MKTFSLILTFTLLAASQAFALPVQRLFQDQKLPTQAMVEHDTWASPAAASNTLMVNAAAANTSASTTLSTFAAQPDVPRNITITTGGTTANVGAGNAVVTGISLNGTSITENIAIGAAQAGTSTGSKAFKSVTSVLFPATTGAGVTVSVGVGSKLGLRRCMDDAGKYIFSEFAQAYETTRGTMATSATAMESNTFTPNGALNGSQVDVFYVQNFRCF